MRVCVAIFSDDVFLRLLRFALSLTLSHGERGRIAESPIMVDFQHHHSLSVEEGQIAENLIMVGFSTIIPSPRGRGLGRGQNLRFSRFSCEIQQILKP